MGLQLVRGTYPIDGRGLPMEVTGLPELLQNAALRLNLPKGKFLYGRELGSRLGELDREDGHAREQAVSLANEALMDMPGVKALEAELLENGAIRFQLVTPLGEGEAIYGEL